jgi:hypothetical protein
MMRRVQELVVLASIVLSPTLAYAQASITGVVRDTSNAILPGVTVEAASPVLIEKVRSVVSDGTGQYRIENLRPGAYTVTFTLPGFATVRREGVELAGTFTATINAEMRVGSLEETITVTSESPIVDVQNTTRQQVMSREILDTIPSGGTAYNLAVLIPGVVSGGATQNVGGMEARGTGGLGGSLTIHGGGTPGTSLMGVDLATFGQGAATATIRPNPAAVQEIAVSTAAVSSEHFGGGVRINYIPKEGGNRYNGTLIASLANGWMQGSNFTDELKSRGLTTPNKIDQNWDIDPGFGGPLVQDRLWFYGAARYVHQSQTAAGMFFNRNANNLNAWNYDPDTSRPIINDTRNPDTHLRVSAQATEKHKVGFLWYNTTNCFCPTDASSSVALEAATRRLYPLQRVVQGDWSAPLTSRLLIEAGGNLFWGQSDDKPWPELNPAMIQVTEQSSGLVYRGAGSANRSLQQWIHSYRAAASYITGAHAFKVGLNERNGHTAFHSVAVNPLLYRFNNGTPNQITQLAFPVDRLANMDHEAGLYAQDKWTVAGLTLGYGLRYDYLATSYPEHHVGPAPLAPARNITFPRVKNNAYHDLTPKLGASYDPFGTGRTALKVSLNKYLTAISIVNNAFGVDANPVSNVVVSTTRSWTDANRNFTPDCDLLSAAANGECGAMANRDFGSVRRGATYDPEFLRGWGKRNYNWEFSGGVQQQLRADMSVDVSYFRNWYGNFAVTDDRAVAASDFDRFQITAPSDPRLPDGGGYVIGDLYNLNPAKFGVPADNFVTLNSNYGSQTQMWQGVDLNFTARPADGVLFQGGSSTGRQVTDNCEILTKLPEMNPVGTPYCKNVPNFLTQVKFIGSYTVPRVDVQMSAAFQSIPGPLVTAAYNAPNALVGPSLGRSLSGSAANVTVNLVDPGTIYGDRLNQLDLRFSKLVRVGRTRTRLNVDIYNALNSSAVLSVNNNFGAWQQPTFILLARYAKLGVQFDF